MHYCRNTHTHTEERTAPFLSPPSQSCTCASEIGEARQRTSAAVKDIHVCVCEQERRGVCV